ncbi:TraX family protein [Cohnella thailandensis]|uniref:Conjugal transfer protein TraX n=1 Tax=Cohnella thailandensis TaxID=557557 RepID=A0A841T741_9BACL|nr:TraX family protein [Cohnella thailandensis]MBB6637890.1 conjugal transfer protein TraX [Cohnella thailandensis]MBP1977402.1 hypothetical protein [Cohnella thailandensis]
MQIIAMLTMLIDHVGFVFFPESAAWRIIGRIAFPLYAYGIVQGFLRTRSRPNYLNRLLMLALISQVPYMLGLQVLRVNVIGTFVVCLAALIWIDRCKSKWAGVCIAAVAAALLEFIPFDYGAYGLLLILMYRYLPQAYWIAVHFVLNVGYFYLNGWEIQFFSLIPTVFLAYSKQLADWKRGFGYRVPNWLWRSFYPAHLFVLAVIVAVREYG